MWKTEKQLSAEIVCPRMMVFIFFLPCSQEMHSICKRVWHSNNYSTQWFRSTSWNIVALSVRFRLILVPFLSKTLKQMCYETAFDDLVFYCLLRNQEAKMWCTPHSVVWPWAMKEPSIRSTSRGRKLHWGWGETCPPLTFPASVWCPH